MTNFNSHAPCGAQLILCQSYMATAPAFQLTRPMRGATLCLVYEDKGYYTISTHTPPCGAQPRPLARRAVLCAPISTHTPHAGRNADKGRAVPPHNPFQLTRPMRGATYPLAKQLFCRKFQLTRPMRGATLNNGYELVPSKFQLTRPMRGATHLNQLLAHT